MEMPTVRFRRRSSSGYLCVVNRVLVIISHESCLVARETPLPTPRVLIELITISYSSSPGFTTLTRLPKLILSPAPLLQAVPPELGVVLSSLDCVFLSPLRLEP